MKTKHSCEKNKRNSLFSRYFGAGRIPCHPRLQRRRLSLSHNSGPVQQRNFHRCLCQPHYCNIKYLFAQIYYSFFSSFNSLRFFHFSGNIYLVVKLFACLQFSFGLCEKCKVFNTNVDITQNSRLDL